MSLKFLLALAGLSLVACSGGDEETQTETMASSMGFTTPGPASASGGSSSTSDDTSGTSTTTGTSETTSSSTTSSCPPGSEGCECLEEQGCELDLACVDNICAAAAGTETDTDTDSGTDSDTDMSTGADPFCGDGIAVPDEL